MLDFDHHRLHDVHSIISFMKDLARSCSCTVNLELSNWVMERHTIIMCDCYLLVLSDQAHLKPHKGAMLTRRINGYGGRGTLTSQQISNSKVSADKSLILNVSG